MEFKKLFEPISINKVQIKNRIVMPSMGLSYTHDYSFNERHRAFYRERATGGVGLLTIGPLAIDKVGAASFTPGIYDDRQIGPFNAFVDELHRDTDVKVAAQLIHMGRYAFSFLTGTPCIAPSAVPSRLTGETPREMTLEDIEAVLQAYVLAARRAKAAGFDLIEILACTGYLISQFLSPITNRRTDDYGGPMENRMRFGLEVVRRVREEVGGDVALGIRIAGNDFMHGGHTNRESAMFAAAAVETGIDAVNVTGGWHETNVPQLTTNVPAGAFLYLARGIKEKVDVPVFASNRLGDPCLAEKALRAKVCDMICWGRPLLADPELPNKVREGRLAEIISCISCNQGCFDSIFSGSPVTCILNPRVGREAECRIQEAEVKKKVVVAGGGPAGMEFALIAAQRGHEVTLYEKEARLGGQVNLAMAPPGKEEFGNVVRSLEGRMGRAGVRVNLNTAVTPKRILEERPDVVVVATGATAAALEIPGIDRPHVVQAWDVLSEKVHEIGQDVVIIGGSATGCETAHFIAAMGAVDTDTFTFLMYHQAENPEAAIQLLHRPIRRITVIDLLPRLAENVGKTARWSLMKSLRLMGVSLRPSTKVIEITDTAVVVEVKEGREAIPADTVILAVGVTSEDALAKDLEGRGISVVVIGDAKKPRRLTEAVREGFEAALEA